MASCAGAPSGAGWSWSSGWRWPTPPSSVAGSSAAPGPTIAGTAVHAVAHERLLAQALIEVATQIAVTSFGVGQQVPHDRQDRVADRDKGALCAAAFGDAAVALAEEGVGAPGRDGDLAQGGGQPWVALAGGRRLGFAG